MKENTLSPHLVWPASSFYWSVLDATDLPGRHTPRQLGYLFEAALPVPIDEVQATFRRIDSNTYLACGVARAILRERATTDDALTLRPSGTPAFIDAPPAIVESINLLEDDFEPDAVRKMRRRGLATCAALMVILTGTLLLGFQRRMNAAQRSIDLVTQERSRVYEEALALPWPDGRAGDVASGTDSGGYSGAYSGGGRQPLELRFVAELRTLNRTHDANGIEYRVADAAESLAELLSVWPVRGTLTTGLTRDPGENASGKNAPGENSPEESFVMTESISITPAAMTVRARVPGSGDATHLAEALRAIREWTLRQPEIQRTRDDVRLTLRFDPAPPEMEKSES